MWISNPKGKSSQFLLNTMISQKSWFFNKMLIRKLEKNIKTAQGFNPIFLKKNLLFSLFRLKVSKIVWILIPMWYHNFFSFNFKSHEKRKLQEWCRISILPFKSIPLFLFQLKIGIFKNREIKARIKICQ